jgi:ketosteroid isomerase-like protein
VSGPTDLVEQLVNRWLAGSHEAALGCMARDCTFSLLRSPPFQGVEALEAFLKGLSKEDQSATVTPLRFLSQGGKVVLLAEVAFVRERGDRSYTEHQPFAWVFAVEDGQVASVTAYTSWDEAKAEAGLAGGAAPDHERGAKRRHLFMRALPAH